MALDTRNKRAGVISLGLWTGRVLPAADGTIDESDRQHLALLYPVTEVVPGAFQPYWALQANKTVGPRLYPE